MSSSSDREECFSVIQKKSLSFSIKSLRLCPSMDLVLLVNDAETSVYRTVNWERLGAIKDVSTSDAAWEGPLLATVEPLKVTNVHHLLQQSATETPTLSKTEGLKHLCWKRIAEVQPITESEWVPRSAHETLATQWEEPSTSLSLLVGLDQKMNLHVYSQGRLPILEYSLSKITYEKCDDSKLAISEASGKAFILQPSKLIVVSWPLLTERPQVWTHWTRLFAQGSRHVSTLEAFHDQICHSWNQSLKPLDDKFRSLALLLTRYGVTANVRTVLGRYLILSTTNDEANALDQFWTSTPLHDQLLQKMQRTMQVSLANVECQVSQSLVAPALALVRLGQRFLESRSNNEASIPINEDLALSFLVAAQELYMIVVTLHQAVVQARLVAEDTVTWLRDQSALTRAAGTANRPRVPPMPDATRRRIESYLLETIPDADNTTEQVWQLGVAKYWEPQQLPQKLGKVADLWQNGIWCEPQRYLEKHVETKTFPLLTAPQSQKNAISVRRAAGPEPDLPPFMRKDDCGLYLGDGAFEYAMVAQAVRNNVDLYAIPLTKGAAATDSACYRCCLVLPDKVNAVEFYASDNDKRHSLCILTGADDRLLYKVDYDSAPFQATENVNSIQVKAQEVGNGSSNGGDGIVWAKTRRVSPGISATLTVSASRGVAAVATSQSSGGTVLELLDMEEDEDDDDSDMEE